MLLYLRNAVKAVLFSGLAVGILVMLMVANLAEAQDDPRPTPTNEPITTPTSTPDPQDPPDPTPTSTTPVTPPPSDPTPIPPGDGGDSPSSEQEVRGSIQGMVYQDVTGNGRCIDTGVEGEGPVAGVPIEFVSSDEQTIITLTSGADGRFGLAAAGASYWAVRARPGADWIVTSEQPLYAPISADNLSVTGINFCVQQATAARVVLPASGAAQPFFLNWLLLLGLLFVGLGLIRYWHERSRLV